MSLNQKIAADRIRQHLERRLAQLLDCEPSALPRLKIGTLIHTIYTLAGDQQSLAGFSTTMSGILHLIGFNLTWDVDENEETKPAEVIN